MKKAWLYAGVAVAVLLSGSGLYACGDKLLALGRGIRFQHAYAAKRPASIIIYASHSAGAEAIKKSQFHTTLKQAGHRLKTVENHGELSQALQKGAYDLILADISDAPALRPEADSAASKPLVVPMLHKPSRKEMAEMEKEYRFYFRDGKAMEALIAIEEAMKSRGRPARAS